MVLDKEVDADFDPMVFIGWEGGRKREDATSTTMERVTLWVFVCVCVCVCVFILIFAVMG